VERKTDTASADEKETLRMAKVMKQKRMITTRRKNSNSGVTRPEKKAALCTENRKNKRVRNERRTSPLQRGKSLRWYDF
jgi:hypothetical protein